jgi:D-alanine-D-alanine ligase-like ATP-grasp enzyme
MEEAMKKIGIIIGGKSVEHEVSIITGLQVFENIDRSLYEPKIIYIQKDGRWLFGDCLHDINISERLSPSAGHNLSFAFTAAYVQAAVSAISDWSA